MSESERLSGVLTYEGAMIGGLSEEAVVATRPW